VRRILVIGGYGGFGARLSKRLLAAGHSVLVGGRSYEKAARFCAVLARAEPVLVDRSGDLLSLLRVHRPDIVVDAAGPFQSSNYAVPEACIAAGVHYLDLADAREFVLGIRALDEAAKRAGVVVIGGASSVPALSGTVARRLVEGLDRVSSVDIAISASTQSTASRSVTHAILSYAGRPIRLWRGGRWSSGFGGSELRRIRFELAGAKPLGRRWVALCDVPDLALLPAMLPGAPTVTFRAGSDRPQHILGLWLASWLVRLGVSKSLTGLTGIFVKLQRATLWAGSQRSAMTVTLHGWRGSDRIERRWTLIAEQASGPEIPTLAAVLLIEEILAHRIDPGARDASQALRLDQFAKPFAALPLRHGTTERVLGPTLYRRAMGEAFDQLPPAVRQMHEVNGNAGAAGSGSVSVGTSFWARLLCRLMHLPPTGDYPVHVTFAERDGVETWTRDFGGYRFASRLRQSGRGVTEQFGPLRFRFDLPSDRDGLRMVLQAWTFFRAPLPLFLAPRIEAAEWEEAGNFRFNVVVALPFVGPIIRYSGWLERLAGDSSVHGETKRAGRKLRTALA
jgi:hypothetical protein